MIWFRRAIGFAVAVLAVLPLHFFLAQRDTGLAGRMSAQYVDIQVGLLWSAFLLVLIPAIVAGRFFEKDPAGRLLRALDDVLRRPSTMTFAIGAGLLSAAVTLLAALLLFEGRPNNVDALVQMTQARYLAAGRLGGPQETGDGFWYLTNSVTTSAGWFSQYPPGHMLLLAAGLALRVEWLVGPVVMGLTTALTVPVFQRLLPGREGLARGAALLAGVSPPLFLQAAAYMNHGTAALCAMLAVYCALRAREGSAAWALGAGAGVTGAAAVRPLAGVIVMLVIAVFLWMQRREDLRRIPALGTLAVIGGIPFLAAHLWYNRVAFGGWTTFGYDLAWGPSHAMGFRMDPWGNTYGPAEGLLYTAADLATLNLNMLEIPLPLVAIVGVYLLTARALEPGVRALAAWALLSVLANAFYWHHAYFMGPRMLAEAIPAWVALAAVALYDLSRRLPAERVLGGRFSMRAAASSAVVVGLAAGLILGPQRVASFGGPWMESFRAPVPPAPAHSLVFVHGSWDARLISGLTSAGVRLDVIETALRQNPTCLVQQHLDSFLGEHRQFGASRTGNGPVLPPLDLVPTSRDFRPRFELTRGVFIRVDESAPFPEQCRRQARADRFGATDAMFFFWLGDLPGLEQGRPMYARDLGPERNARLIARHPERSAWMYLHPEKDAPLRLVPYEEGRALLWGAP